MKPLTRILTTCMSAVALTAMSLPAVAEPLGSAGDLRYKRNSETIAAGSVSKPTDAEVFTYCDKGWDAVAAGVAVKKGAERGIATTGKGGGRYSYNEVWQRSGAESKVTGYTICLKNAPIHTATGSQFDMPGGGGQVFDTATCEAGHVVSGGMRAIGEGTRFSLNSSYPIDDASDDDVIPDDGWRVYTQYEGAADPDADAVLVDNVCLEGDQPVYKKKMVTAAAESPTTVKVACPKGRTVVGGGIYADGASSRSHILVSRMFDSKDAGKVPEDGWLGTIHNTSDATVNMTVHAICR